MSNVLINKELAVNGRDDLICGMNVAVLNQLNNEQRSMLLSGHNDIQNKITDSGLIGKAIGANVENATINTAFILILLLLVYCVVDMVGAYWRCRPFEYKSFDMVLPVITLALGYIFGKK